MPANRRAWRSDQMLRTLPLMLLLGIGPMLGTVAGQQASQAAAPASAQPDASLPVYLRDRGTGVPTSMFGTYIRGGEAILYPFFEYYRDRNLEYSPSEFGVNLVQDFRGRYRAKEGVFLFAYGLTDDLAMEVEAAVISASLVKSPADLSAMPSRIDESGLGDVEGQLRWRWRRETAERPELFSYVEIVLPHHEHKPLIGLAGVEVKVGTGLVRGFDWGTVSMRAALEYASASPSPFDIGEYGVDYLKRLSPAWRVLVGIEGTQDEVSLITEAQWHFHPRAFIKINNGLGLTSKATDWAPEIGILFTLPTR
jgi:hypothetical protein